jgi:hypothetical protein
MVNFVIVKSRVCRNGKAPIHQRPLAVLLNDLGVERTIKTNSGKRQIGLKPTLRFLWEKFEAARKAYFERIRQLKRLFARRGIGNLCH